MRGKFGLPRNLGSIGMVNREQQGEDELRPLREKMSTRRMYVFPGGTGNAIGHVGWLGLEKN